MLISDVAMGCISLFLEILPSAPQPQFVWHLNMGRIIFATFYPLFLREINNHNEVYK